MPSPPKSNVVDLGDRRLARMLAGTPHVRVEADSERRLVRLHLHEPDLGGAIVEITLPQVLALIEGLVTEGAKVGHAEWSRWIDHVVGDGDKSVRVRVENFVRAWRDLRPDRQADHSAVSVHRAALDIAARVLGDATHGLKLESDALRAVDRVAGALANAVAHLTYEGEGMDRTSCGARDCPARLPWDTL